MISINFSLISDAFLTAGKMLARTLYEEVEFLESLINKAGQISRIPAYLVERTGLSDFLQDSKSDFSENH